MTTKCTCPHYHGDSLVNISEGCQWPRLRLPGQLYRLYKYSEAGLWGLNSIFHLPSWEALAQYLANPEPRVPIPCRLKCPSASLTCMQRASTHDSQVFCCVYSNHISSLIFSFFQSLQLHTTKQPIFALLAFI